MSLKDVLSGIGIGIGFFLGQTLMQLLVLYFFGAFRTMGAA